MDIEAGLSGIFGRPFQFEPSQVESVLPELWPWLHRFRRYRRGKLTASLAERWGDSGLDERAVADDYSGNDSDGEEDYREGASTGYHSTGEDFGYITSG